MDNRSTAEEAMATMDHNDHPLNHHAHYDHALESLRERNAVLRDVYMEYLESVNETYRDALPLLLDSAREHRVGVDSSSNSHKRRHGRMSLEALITILDNVMSKTMDRLKSTLEDTKEFFEGLLKGLKLCGVSGDNGEHSYSLHNDNSYCHSIPGIIMSLAGVAIEASQSLSTLFETFKEYDEERVRVESGLGDISRDLKSMEEELTLFHDRANEILNSSNYDKGYLNTLKKVHNEAKLALKELYQPMHDPTIMRMDAHPTKGRMNECMSEEWMSSHNDDSSTKTTHSVDFGGSLQSPLHPPVGHLNDHHYSLRSSMLPIPLVGPSCPLARAVEGYYALIKNIREEARNEYLKSLSGIKTLDEFLREDSEAYRRSDQADLLYNDIKRSMEVYQDFLASIETHYKEVEEHIAKMHASKIKLANAKLEQERLQNEMMTYKTIYEDKVKEIKLANRASTRAEVDELKAKTQEIYKAQERYQDAVKLLKYGSHDDSKTNFILFSTATTNLDAVGKDYDRIKTSLDDRAKEKRSYERALDKLSDGMTEYMAALKDGMMTIMTIRLKGGWEPGESIMGGHNGGSMDEQMGVQNDVHDDHKDLHNAHYGHNGSSWSPGSKWEDLGRSVEDKMVSLLALMTSLLNSRDDIGTSHVAVKILTIFVNLKRSLRQTRLALDSIASNSMACRELKISLLTTKHALKTNSSLRALPEALRNVTMLLVSLSDPSQHINGIIENVLEMECSVMAMATNGRNGSNGMRQHGVSMDGHYDHHDGPYGGPDVSRPEGGMTTNSEDSEGRTNGMDGMNGRTDHPSTHSCHLPIHSGQLESTSGGLRESIYHACMLYLKTLNDGFAEFLPVFSDSIQMYQNCMSKIHLTRISHAKDTLDGLSIAVEIGKQFCDKAKTMLGLVIERPLETVLECLERVLMGMGQYGAKNDGGDEASGGGMGDRMDVVMATMDHSMDTHSDHNSDHPSTHPDHHNDGPGEHKRPIGNWEAGEIFTITEESIITIRDDSENEHQNGSFWRPSREPSQAKDEELMGCHLGSLHTHPPYSLDGPFTPADPLAIPPLGVLDTIIASLAPLKRLPILTNIHKANGHIKRADAILRNGHKNGVHNEHNDSPVDAHNVHSGMVTRESTKDDACSDDKDTPRARLICAKNGPIEGSNDHSFRSTGVRMRRKKNGCTVRKNGCVVQRNGDVRRNDHYGVKIKGYQKLIEAVRKLDKSVLKRAQSRYKRAIKKAMETYRLKRGSQIAIVELTRAINEAECTKENELMLIMDIVDGQNVNVWNDHNGDRRGHPEHNDHHYDHSGHSIEGNKREWASGVGNVKISSLVDACHSDKDAASAPERPECVGMNEWVGMDGRMGVHDGHDDHSDHGSPWSPGYHSSRWSDHPLQEDGEKFLELQKELESVLECLTFSSLQIPQEALVHVCLANILKVLQGLSYGSSSPPSCPSSGSSSTTIPYHSIRPIMTIMDNLTESLLADNSEYRAAREAYMTKVRNNESGIKDAMSRYRGLIERAKNDWEKARRELQEATLSGATFAIGNAKVMTTMAERMYEDEVNALNAVKNGLERDILEATREYELVVDSIMATHNDDSIGMDGRYCDLYKAIKLLRMGWTSRMSHQMSGMVPTEPPGNVHNDHSILTHSGHPSIPMESSFITAITALIHSLKKSTDDAVKPAEEAHREESARPTEHPLIALEIDQMKNYRHNGSHLWKLKYLGSISVKYRAGTCSGNPPSGYEVFEHRPELGLDFCISSINYCGNVQTISLPSEPITSVSIYYWSSSEDTKPLLLRVDAPTGPLYYANSGNGTWQAMHLDDESIRNILDRMNYEHNGVVSIYLDQTTSYGYGDRVAVEVERGNIDYIYSSKNDEVSLDILKNYCRYTHCGMRTNEQWRVVQNAHPGRMANAVSNDECPMPSIEGHNGHSGHPSRPFIPSSTAPFGRHSFILPSVGAILGSVSHGQRVFGGLEGCRERRFLSLAVYYKAKDKKLKRPLVLLLTQIGDSGSPIHLYYENDGREWKMVENEENIKETLDRVAKSLEKNNTGKLIIMTILGCLTVAGFLTVATALALKLWTLENE